MRARLLASSVLASIALCNIPLALAEGETAETIESLTASLAGLSCTDKEGRGVGQCISDVLKRIKKIEKEFALQYKAEAVAWRKEHDIGGINKEYVLAQKAFNDEMQMKRKAFQDALTAARKKFFDQQNIVRVQKGEVKTAGSSPLSTSAEAEARKACVSRDDEEDEVRVCLRNALQRKNAVEKRLRPVRAKIQMLKERAEQK